MRNRLNDRVDRRPPRAQYRGLFKGAVKVDMVLGWYKGRFMIGSILG